jgi:hypothetical protein
MDRTPVRGGKRQQAITGDFSHIRAFCVVAKRNPLSAEWRDADVNVLYGAYYTYQFDQSGNWTSRQVWVSSLATGRRELYETDNRLITYWD